jgi:hypothetical protein
MAAPSVNELVAQLQAYRLLPADQLAVVTSDLIHRYPDPRNLLRDLVQRGWLTPHQANRLLQGRGSELAPTAPQQSVAPASPTLLNSGVRWRLGLIIGGVFLLIVLIAFLARPKSNRKDEPSDPTEKGRTDQKNDDWPDDLERLPGRTESSRDGETFTAKNTRDGDSVEVLGRIVFEEVVIDRIIVRRKRQVKREYDDMETVPAAQRKVAGTLRELGRRRVFGEWTE